MLQNNVRRLKSRNLRKLLRNSSDMRPVWAEDQSSAVFDFKNNRVYAKGKRWPLKGFPGLVVSGGENGTVIRNGVIVPATAPRVGDDGLVVEEARTNKCEAYAAPTDLTGVSKAGDAAATLSVVDDSAELAAAGLDEITGGNAYKLDNSAGSTAAFVVIAGQTGNTNPHSHSVRARSGNGSPTVRIGGSPPVGSVTVSTGAYQKYSAENISPSSSASTLEGRCSAGEVLYFVLPQLEEGSFATSCIPTAGSTVTRSADSISFTDFAALGLTSAVLSAGYTVVVEYNDLSTQSSTAAFMLRFSDGTVNNEIMLRIGLGASNDISDIFAKAAGSVVVDSVGPEMRNGNRAAYRFAENDYAGSVAGGSPVKDTSGALPSGLNLLQLGPDAVLTLRRLTIIPTPVTDAQFRSLSLR